MNYKKFEIQLIVQILLILAVCLLLAFSTQKDYLRFSIIYFSIVLVVQVFILYKYVNNRNKKLYDFISEISIGDADDKLTDNTYDKNNILANKITNELSNKYHQIELEKTLKELYLVYVLESVQVGLLAINDGKIEFLNSYLTKTFKKEDLLSIQHIDQLSDNLNLILGSVKIGMPYVHNFNIQGENTPLSIHLSYFKIDQKEIKLYSFYNLKNELQENEVNTWQEVIRVISHEIMNSISPIKSIASTISETLKEEIPSMSESIPKKELENIYEAIKAIEKRSLNLTEFVNNYKKLSRIPQPVLKEFSLNDLFKRVEKLFRIDFKEHGIEFKNSIKPDDMVLNADEGLIEQIIINMITNSAQALEHTKIKAIELKAYAIGTTKNIEIIDNGCGINNADLKRIFLPFYTNKANGSGIGLSLSLQIMRMHGGNISARSETGGQTVFTLMF